MGYLAAVNYKHYREVAMLVLTRREGESLKIGDDIIVTVTKIRNEQVRVGVTAPSGVAVLREEIASDNDKAGEKPADSASNK